MAEKRPTILQIIPELDTGGAELSTIEIADAIQSAGGRCIVLTEGGRLVQRLRDTGAEVQFFPAAVKSPWRLLWNAHRIVNVIGRDGRRPGARPQPRARLERAHRGSPRRRAVRHHLPWRLLGEVGRQAAVQQRDGARRRGDRQLALHLRPHPHALRHAARQGACHLSRRRRPAVRSGQRGTRARRRRARPLGHRRQEARRPARRTPDDMEGPEVRHRSGRASGATGRARRHRLHPCRRRAAARCLQGRTGSADPRGRAR